MKTKTDTIWIYIFLLPTFIIFLLFYFTPIVTVFYTSLTRWDGYNAPLFIGFENYIRLFMQREFLISFVNLLWWSLIAATLHVGYGVLVAFVFFSKPFGWRFTRAVFMVPNVISAAAWAMIYKFVFNDNFGILNSSIRIFNPGFHVNWFSVSPYAFCAVTFTWLFYAVIVTLIVFTDLMAIPKDIHEAALIDGASQWTQTWYINLPLCRNAIGTGIILSITSRIAMYESIALTSRGGPGDDTMNIPLILVNAITNMKYGYANAAAVVMFILGIITLVVINRIFNTKEPMY
jgi:raffinose/stachyose/melibiose transport system permease protein